MIHDTQSILILYLCCSHKIILRYKNLIFNDGFLHHLTLIYKHDSARKLFAEFFIKYWGLPEIQKHKISILDKFSTYKIFVKDIMFMGLLHDDVQLYHFNSILLGDYSPNKKIINDSTLFKINKYMSWGVFTECINQGYMTESYKSYIDNRFQTLKKILYFTESNKSDEYKENLLEFLENNKITLSIHKWDFKTVKTYFDYIIKLQYVQTDLDKYINTTPSYSKYEFNTLLRNTLKFYLLDRGVFYDINIHKFLLTHNNFVFVYEYFTDKVFQEMQFEKTVIEVFKHKMLKNKNIITTLYNNKYLTHILYENDKELLFNYYVKNYDFLNGDHISFIMKTIFENTHAELFYKIISEKNTGRMNKKERNIIYNSIIKKNKIKLSPKLSF